MRLAGHSQRLDLALPFIERTRPGYWLAIDPDPASAQAVVSLGVKLLVRHHSAYDFNEGAVAERIAQGVSPSRAALDFWQSCEREDWWPSAWGVLTPPAMAMPSSSPDVLAWAIAFQSILVSLFRSAGCETVVCNVPTGHDGYVVPGARWYGCQEYGWPTVLAQAPWHAWRHKRWFSEIRAVQPQARLFITEVGISYLLAP